MTRGAGERLRHGQRDRLHPMTPAVRRFDSLDDFVAFALDRLMRDEPKNSMLLGIINRLKQRGLPEGAVFSGAEDEHGPRAVALHTPPYFAALGDADDEAAHALGASFADVALPGVVGPTAAATAFSAAYSDARKCTIRPLMVQGLHRLDALIPGPTHPGSARLANEADTALVAAWIGAFCDDCKLPREERDAGVKAVPSLIARGVLAFWCLDGEPVAMAGRAGSTPNIGRVSYVYTPPALRGRGHASAITEWITARILEEGKRYACLTTDLSNGTSNALYARLGYRLIGEASMIAFDGS